MKIHSLFFLGLTALSYGLTLDDAIIEAIQKNPLIEEKEKIYNEIYHDAEAAKSGYLPKVNLTVSAPIKNTRKNGFVNTNYDYELTLTQNIFNGFKDVSKRSIEIARYGSALYTLKEIKNSFSLEIINAYLDVVKEIERLEIQYSSLQNRENLFNKINIKYDGGMGTQLEYRLSKTSLNLAKIDLEDQKHNLAQSMLKLQRYLNREVVQDEINKVSHDIVVPKDAKMATENAMLSHPSLYVSKLNIDVVKHEIENTTNNFYPQLDIVASYFDGEKGIYKSIDKYYDIYFQLTYNIFNGGNDYHSRAKNNVKLEQKKLILEDVQREIKYKIQSKYYLYNLLKRKTILMDEYVESKKLALESFYSVFSIGKADLRDIIDTTESLFDARKMQIDLKYELLKSKYAILEAIGILPEFEKSFHRSNEAAGKQKLTQYEILVKKLHIRNKPSLKSDIIGSYKIKDLVVELQNENEWILTNKGWVAKKYLKEVYSE